MLQALTKKNKKQSETETMCLFGAVMLFSFQEMFMSPIWGFATGKRPASSHYGGCSMQDTPGRCLPIRMPLRKYFSGFAFTPYSV